MMDPFAAIGSLALGWASSIELRLRGLNKLDKIEAIQEEIKSDVERIENKLDRLIERGK